MRKKKGLQRVLVINEAKCFKNDNKTIYKSGYTQINNSWCYK